MIGNSMSAALIGRDGSIDWLCLPRFDSPSCFTSLLGTPEQGRWKIAPSSQGFVTRRRYRPGTLILETEFETPDGSVARVLDLMVPGSRVPILIRLIEGVKGEVSFDVELVIRFDYGSLVPWVRRHYDGEPPGIVAIGGPDTIRIHTPVPLKGRDFKTCGRFDVKKGQSIPFTLGWHPSHEAPSPEVQAVARDPEKAIRQATKWWQEWSSRSSFQTPWSEPVERSLITLKALIHGETGGIVAAPTTSLPERVGGVRNWDYRQCWLRDASFTLRALTNAGYHEEAHAWREWLLRAVAGKPDDLRIMYGLSGERRLTELELPWLPGYENSKPVRVGNGAYKQLQLDVFGEVMGAFHFSHTGPLFKSKHKRAAIGTHVSPDDDFHDWRVHRKLVEYLEAVWDKPDNGIWEIRGERKHFTHSKMMAWVAFNRGARAIDELGLDGPGERWRKTAARLHEQICTEGFSREKNSFVQHYGCEELDASVLMMPLVGFLDATDPKMVGTVKAIQRELNVDGFIQRYRTEDRESANVDGLPPGEGVFLACSFWMADCLNLQGDRDGALKIFERLLSVRNDVGLLAEEYDPRGKRLLGNFPQAFSHVALINSAIRLKVHEAHLKTGDPPASVA
jgi:GH15 family glucan-1,4-alpha-glucosidase